MVGDPRRSIVYEPVDPKVSFPKMEEDIVRFWESGRIFEKSISQREGKDEFVFYDGPPFATGLPHFGHFVPGTIKDIIPRYKAMRGFKVERRFGWDCHGLPVENLIEKELGLDSKTDIERYGIANFNEACRASVLRYVEGMADDHDPRRPLGRLRPRLQDDGPRLHGVHLVGRSRASGTRASSTRATTSCPTARAARPCSPTTSSPWAATRTSTTRRSPSSSRSAQSRRQGTGVARRPAARLLPRLDDDALDPALEPRPLPRPGHRLCPRAATPGRRRALRPRRVAARRHTTKRTRSPRSSGARRAASSRHRVRAPLPVFRLAARAVATVVAAPSARSRRPRHHRGRHGHRAHRAGLRRGGPRGHEGHGRPDDLPDRRRVQVHRRGERLRGNLREGRRQGDHGQAQGRGQARPARADPATPIRTAGAARTRSSTARSAAGSSRSTRSSPRCSRPTPRSTGCRSTSRTAASANGSRAPATGRSRAAATGAIPCRSGNAPTAARRSASAVERRAREALRRQAHGPAQALRRRGDRPLHSADAAERCARIPEVLDCWFESGSMPYAQVHYPFENKEHFERALPRRLHLRGPRPDPRLVLLAHRPRRRALRRPRLQGVRRQRPRPRRGRQEDVQVASATSPIPRRSWTSSAPTRCASS